MDFNNNIKTSVIYNCWGFIFFTVILCLAKRKLLIIIIAAIWLRILIKKYPVAGYFFIFVAPKFVRSLFPG
jgi:hypothetical protein